MNSTEPFDVIAAGNVFISYAREDDGPFVERLYRDLTRHGVHVWWDRKAMESRGRTFLQEIRDAIAGADRLVLIVGPIASASDYVRVEWEFALERCKVVMPVLRLGKRATEASSDDYSLIPDKLAKQHCIDFRPPRAYEGALDELLRNLSVPSPTLATLHGVLALPPHFVPRPEEMDGLRESVMADLFQPTVITAAKQATALHGMGGIGKSVLAAAFAQNCATRFAFPNGVIWATVGQKPDLLGTLRSVGKALGDTDPQHYLDLQTGGECLNKALPDKVCLLILDDIWNPAHAEVFLNALNPENRSRILITTRDRQLVNALGAREHRVDVLSDEQSLRLLAEWADQAVEKLPPEAREIIQECGNLPLALAMIGAMARGKPKNRWANALYRLRAADLKKIRQQFPNYLYPDLLRAIQVSVKALARKFQKRYLDFAVFPEDTPVPEAVLQTFWKPQGLDEHDTADIIDLLVSRSLVRHDEEGNLTLHDLQFDYVRKQHKSLPALHNQLLNAYAALCPDGWHTGPNDVYFFDHLLHHRRKPDGLKRFIVCWLRRRTTGTTPGLKRKNPPATLPVIAATWHTPGDLPTSGRRRATGRASAI